MGCWQDGQWMIWRQYKMAQVRCGPDDNLHARISWSVTECWSRRVAFNPVLILLGGRCTASSNHFWDLDIW